MNAKHLTEEQQKIMTEFLTYAYALKGMVTDGLNTYETDDYYFYFPIPKEFAAVFGDNGRITEISMESIGYVTLQIFGVKSIVSVMDFSDEIVEDINTSMCKTICTILTNVKPLKQ